MSGWINCTGWFNCHEGFIWTTDMVRNVSSEVTGLGSSEHRIELVQERWILGKFGERKGWHFSPVSRIEFVSMKWKKGRWQNQGRQTSLQVPSKRCFKRDRKFIVSWQLKAEFWDAIKFSHLKKKKGACFAFCGSGWLWVALELEVTESKNLTSELFCTKCSLKYSDCAQVCPAFWIFSNL